MSHQSLTCPICLDWLEEPIISPCCGNAISRQCFATWLENARTCPVCRTNLNDFNPQIAPTSKNIIDMVTEAQNNNVQIPAPVPIFPEQKNPNQGWFGMIKRICNNNINQSVIGKLELINKNKTHFKTLLIPVIDKSGSMAGRSFDQVKYSLSRIVDITYNNPHLMTNLVSYCDSASTIEINTGIAQSHYEQIVRQLSAGGGTSFKSAFNEILKICSKYKDDNLISSIVILFLTDGEDSSVSGTVARTQLVMTLKKDIEAIWHKEYTVHTIGFTGNHDHVFLNELRLIGKEGAYRYADPKEDTDCISSKINSILDVIVVTTSVPIKLFDNGIPLIINENGKYWLNLTKCNMSNPLEFQISIDNAEPITIIAEFAEEDNDPVISNEWFSLLIDQIASELLLLSNKENSIDKELHCEILQQRSRAIRCRLERSSSNYVRLEKLVESLNIIQAGGTVDQRKLNDAKFEGQFQTKTNLYTNTNTNTITLPSQNSGFSQPKYMPRYIPWETMNPPAIKRCDSSDKSSEIFKVLGSYDTSQACDWISDNLSSYLDEKDKNGSNGLIVASSIGRVNVIKTILEHSSFDKSTINETNNLGYNAIDMATLFGYWISFDLLVEHGAIPTIEGKLLLRTCISKNYYNLANRLLKNNFAFITEDMENSAPTGEATRWLNDKSQKEISMETAILKGMIDEVENKLNNTTSNNTTSNNTISNNTTSISWKSLTEIFHKSSSDHVKIVSLLLSNNKANANEVINIVDQGENEIIWPLFIAAEKGNLNMVKLLLKYSDVNKQNLKGTTPLWIACCNKHIDVILELIQAGADPNITNFKGDSPLIPACQKGSDSIVEILLESGADLNAYNKNRDNPVLICCRTGQAKILEILLKRFHPTELKTMLSTYAEIDGFVPLLASTELDKVECIKVCVKYGANLEERTQLDNQIISGATAVHLAAFYGRINALRVLQDLGADIISQTVTHGYTPLHIAIKQSQKDVARYLLTLPQGKQCLQIRDNDNRLPVYYANKEGNESIMEEFFINKLEKMLNSVMFAEPNVTSACADVLVKYGQSLGCYEYNEITDMACANGSNLLSNALLTGNKSLIDAFINMNANQNMKDDYGLSPMFWKAYLGYDISDIQIPNETLDQLNKVALVGKTSMQNKLLLNLKAEPPQNIPKLLLNENSLLNKMKDGYAFKVHNKVLATLKNSRGEEQSIIGFIEKLKNGKVFPLGKQYLEYIIWNSKIHLIKIIASGETILNAVHLLALYLYSSNQIIFENVNLGISNYKENNIWNPFICCLYQAIDLLPPYCGEVYRGVNILFNLEDFAIGKTLKWDTFAICSREFAGPSELINMKTGIIFIIHSKTGKDISSYSKNPVDAEIIFSPGTEFLIQNYYVGSTICLAQANIRKSTYSVKDTDLMKAMKGECCIIVELVQV